MAHSRRAALRQPGGNGFDSECTHCKKRMNTQFLSATLRRCIRECARKAKRMRLEVQNFGLLTQIKRLAHILRIANTALAQQSMNRIKLPARSP